MAETTVYAGTDDAILRSVNADWAARRAGTGLLYEYTADAKQYFGSWVNAMAIWLGGFDTSGIGTDEISAVEFGVYASSVRVSETPNFKLVAFDYGAEPGTEDWVPGATLAGMTVLGSVAGSGLSAGYVVISSTANLIAAINKTGLTKLYLYCDYLDSASAPNSNSNAFDLVCADNATNKPYLKITHAPGASGIDGSGATQTAAAQASGSGSVDHIGSGAAQTAAAQISGQGVVGFQGSGAVQTAPAQASGAGVVQHSGSGALQTGAASIEGAGTVIGAPATGSGAVETAPAQIAGQGTVGFGASGAVQTAPAEVSGAGAVTIAGSGALLAAAARISGAGTVTGVAVPGQPIDRQPLVVLDPDGDVVGFVLAAVRWTQRLTGAYQLEQITIPRDQLLSSGATISKIAYIDSGWYLQWDGYRYIVESADGDLETGITVKAVDAATELANFYCSYSPGPATFLNQLPSVIGSAILSGKCGRPVRNPGFGILDSSDLPTNWSHPSGWTSALVSNRRVWASDTGTKESYSDDRPCTPGISYQVKVDMATASVNGTRGVMVRWIKADGSSVDSAATNLAS